MSILPTSADFWNRWMTHVHVVDRRKILLAACKAGHTEWAYTIMSTLNIHAEPGLTYLFALAENYPSVFQRIIKNIDDFGRPSKALMKKMLHKLDLDNLKVVAESLEMTFEKWVPHFTLKSAHAYSKDELAKFRGLFDDGTDTCARKCLNVAPHLISVILLMFPDAVYAFTALDRSAINTLTSVDISALRNTPVMDQLLPHLLPSQLTVIDSEKLRTVPSALALKIAKNYLCDPKMCAEICMKIPELTKLVHTIVINDSPKNAPILYKCLNTCETHESVVELVTIIKKLGHPVLTAIFKDYST